MRGFVASSIRDAPYAGLFVLLYEAIKRESSKPRDSLLLRLCLRHLLTAYVVPSAYATSIHSFSAAAAGGIATMATHPFDVIKVLIRH